MESEEKKGRELTSDEKKEMMEGFWLEEMVNTSGWKNVAFKWLETRAYHSWTDPRETISEKEWLWRELNAFYSADNAKTFMNSVQEAITRAHYLKDIELGNIIDIKKMKI